MSSAAIVAVAFAAFAFALEPSRRHAARHSDPSCTDPSCTDPSYTDHCRAQARTGPVDVTAFHASHRFLRRTAFCVSMQHKADSPLASARSNGSGHFDLRFLSKNGRRIRRTDSGSTNGSS
jgi:hypothetical protein